MKQLIIAATISMLAATNSYAGEADSLSSLVNNSSHTLTRVDQQSHDMSAWNFPYLIAAHSTEHPFAKFDRGWITNTKGAGNVYYQTTCNGSEIETIIIKADTVRGNDWDTIYEHITVSTIGGNCVAASPAEITKKIMYAETITFSDK